MVDLRRLTASALICLLLSGCATPEARERWKTAAAVVAVGALVVAAAKGGGGSTPSQVYDHDWAWDWTINNGRYIWQCRGMQSGQFADNYRCANKSKIDNWPNN